MKNTFNYGRPLKAMPYAQVRVVNTDKGIGLYSYRTLVSEIKGEWLYCYGLYSMTTRKHLGAFGKEFTPTIPYHIFKMCYEDDMRYNIATGEIEKIERGC